MSNATLLDWEDLGPFSYPNMYRKDEIKDGNCFFHSVLDAFYIPYMTANSRMNKTDFVKKLRSELAVSLDKEYLKLANGQLPALTKLTNEASLESLKKLLDSNKSIDSRFNELISNMINKDIYILDETTKDVYMTATDANLIYKNRSSIVLHVQSEYYESGHYDLIGVMRDDQLYTLFSPTDEFIVAIRTRMLEKIKHKSEVKT